MKHFEITFASVNSKHYAKPLAALVVAPDKIGPRTGAMLFTHGWGGNRFQHQDKMEWVADRFDLVCVSVEFRQSGYDFDPVRGAGSDVPYDLSFYQTFDVLNGLRTVLGVYELNRKRLFHYGGSQGGHIALLSAVFAPRTFGFIYASSPVTHVDADIAGVGREFAPHELEVRDAIELSRFIKCPVFLEYGGADKTVPCETHARALAARLRSHRKNIVVKRYKTGDHDLTPDTTKLAAFKAMAAKPMRTLRLTGRDDFLAGGKVSVPCSNKTLCIDWSQPADSLALFRWA